MKKLLTVNAIFITLLLLTGCATKAPDKKTILESVASLGITILSQDNVSDYGGDPIHLEAKSCEITRQQTEDKGNTTYCTISMSNDSFEAIVDCVIYYDLFDDGKWYPNYYIIDSCSLTPLTGIDKNTAIEHLAKALEAENKEIDGGIPGDTYIYPSNYRFDLINQETDLESLTDALIFDYVKESEICTESGEVSADFIFDEKSGSWICAAIDDSRINYEYHPEGQWRFDIYTYYIKLNITDVDYSNNTATIYSNGRLFQTQSDSDGFDQSETVSFSITDNGMEFSPLSVPGKKYKIILLLKKDNMYWAEEDDGYFTRVSFKREI